jgi:hypothetical protein
LGDERTVWREEENRRASPSSARIVTAVPGHPLAVHLLSQQMMVVPGTTPALLSISNPGLLAVDALVLSAQMSHARMRSETR